MSARPLLLALALAAVVGVSAANPAPDAVGARAGVGEIVFVSARATENPGEIYALGAGKAPRPVFHSPYAEVGLATAPKGRALAFWSDRSGSWRLMISPDGSSLRTVAMPAAGALARPLWAPVFSPDGTRVLIPYTARDAIAPIPALALATVTSGPAADLERLCGLPPTWAPDGRALACATPDQASVQVADMRGRVLFSAPGKLALWSPRSRIAVSDGTRTSVLSESGRVIAHFAGAARAWSPDGRRLALARPGGLALVAPARGAVARLVARTGAALPWAAFTPDGREIAFAGAPGGARIAAVAGGSSRAFSALPGGTWSRDGRYAVAVPARQGVHVELRDGLGRVRAVSGALPSDDHSESIVAWSADGRLLCDTSASGLPELWSMHADGSGQVRLTTTAGQLAEPAWSAAGTRIAYSSAAPGGGSIVLADARGRTLARVGADQVGTADDSPSWSPSGRRIAVANSQAGGVTVVDTAGGRRTDVAVDGVAPAWSPDGATIAFVDLDDGTVWGSAANGANRHRLLPAAIRGVRGLAWSPDGKRLAFSTDNGISIAASNGIDPGRAIVSARAPGRPSFSPDGSLIAYAAETGAVHRYRAIFVAGVDGRERRQLTTGPYDSRDPAWRPAPR